MCGIIGGVSPNRADLELLRDLILESKIRGLHATGITWWDKSLALQTVIEPVPANAFLKLFDLRSILNPNGSFACIVHTRYSTSDLVWNQPIVSSDQGVAIAHNGVISQAAPEDWEKLFGYKCVTRNDSELVLHSILSKGAHGPLEQFEESSMAYLSLMAGQEGNAGLYGARNGQRPLYRIIPTPASMFFASTRDIFRRVGVRDDEIGECEKDFLYKYHFDEDGIYDYVVVDYTRSTPDLQHMKSMS